MNRPLALGLVLLATAASAADLALATRHLEPARVAPSRKVQWAPSGNFQALHARAVFRGETGSAARPYGREGREAAAGFGIFLSRDSVGASSYLSSPNALGPWSYAGLNPARYVDPDGRQVPDDSKYAPFVGRVFDREFEGLSKDQLLDIILEDDASYSTGPKARKNLEWQDLQFLQSLACSALSCRKTGVGPTGWVGWRTTQAGDLISNSRAWKAATSSASAVVGAYRAGRADLVATGGDVAAPMLDGLNVYAGPNVTRSDYVSKAATASATLTDISKFVGESTVDLGINEVEGMAVVGTFSTVTNRVFAIRNSGKILSRVDREVAPVLAPLEKSSSKRLGEALSAAGHHRPPGSAAHHIVAGDAPAAETAREILRKFGIGINEAPNGVFLPESASIANPGGLAVHGPLHTKAYYEAVNDELLQATTRTEALEVLESLRKRLLGGGL